MPIDEAKVSDAVRQCVELCRGKRTGEMFPTIRKFMSSLASAGNWTSVELRIFEADVTRTIIFGPSRGAVFAGAARAVPGGKQAIGAQAGVTTV